MAHPWILILPSPEVAEPLRKSHRVSQPVGAVVGTLELLDPAPRQDVGLAGVPRRSGAVASARWEGPLSIAKGVAFTAGV